MEPAPLIFTDCQPVYHLVKLQFQDPIIIVAYLYPFFFLFIQDFIVLFLHLVF